MARIRISSLVTLSPKGEQAWGAENLIPPHRAILTHLRAAPQQTDTVEGLIQILDVADRNEIGRILSILARNSWVLIPDAPLPRPAEPEAPVEASGEEALSQLLTRRPPPPETIDLPVEPVAPAIPAAPAVEPSAIPKTAIEVHSDDVRDRRMLEAMGILAAPPPGRPEPPARNEETRRDRPASPRELEERMRQRNES